MVVRTSIGALLGGIATSGAGIPLVAQTNLPPGWEGIAMGVIGAIGTIVGAVATWLTNRHKLRNNEADSLTAANEKLRSDMFQQIGALKIWSEAQDKRLEILEQRKQRCIKQLMIARKRIVEMGKHVGSECRVH
jgi:Na+/glutamate symporter